MMKYLPFEDFEIHTQLSSDQVFYKLRAAVDTQRKWWIFTNKPFWGEVERHYFRIWRTTWGNRNHPIVIGKIQAYGLGSCIRVNIRLPFFSYLFCMIWLGAVWVIFFGGIANLVIQKIKTGIWEIASPWDLLPLIGMFAFGYLLSVGFFMSEAIDIKEYLLWLSETKKENIIYIDKIFGLSESQIIKSLFGGTFLISLGWIVFKLFQ